VTNTLECAGNGRSLQSPKVPGIQWGKGAVGNARFSGPSLKSLLEKAGLKDTAKHVVFRDRDGLIDYFSANFGPDQAAYDAPRTAVKAVAKPRPTAKH
jgi:DMSO/TMAO reductase YedYZ molybdopterin-dependent catalytic subunit